MRTVLLILLITAGGLMIADQNYKSQFLVCSMPVLEYTTGEGTEADQILYSDSVEWVIESYHVLPSSSGMPGRYEGWVILVKPTANGDEELEDFITRDDELAQVKFRGTWILQADFERVLCDESV